MKHVHEPDWDDFRVFLELARTGQLAAAARRLKVDASTVSRRIGQLEVGVNAKLFNRNKVGLELTDAGRRLLLHLERIEPQLASAREAIQGGIESYVGAVRVAMMEGIGSLFVARHVPAFRSRYPAIRLELVTSPNSVSVTRREADIFLSFFEPSGRGLWHEKIGSFQLALYGAPAYLAAHGTPATLDDLGSHEFVDYIEDLIAIDAVRWLRDVVQQPKVAFHSNSMIAQMNAAAAGVGLVLLPCFAGDTDDRLMRIAGAGFSTTRGVWLSAHHDLRDLPRIKAVIRFLENLVQHETAVLQPLGGTLPA